MVELNREAGMAEVDVAKVCDTLYTDVSYQIVYNLTRYHKQRKYKIHYTAVDVALIDANLATV